MSRGLCANIAIDVKAVEGRNETGPKRPGCICTCLAYMLLLKIVTCTFIHFRFRIQLNDQMTQDQS